MAVCHYVSNFDQFVACKNEGSAESDETDVVFSVVISILMLKTSYLL
jgi:hypothetical protein